MFHQIWAALLYLYGLLLNSIYQCPEPSHLTTQDVDGKEVRTENGGKLTVGALRDLSGWPRVTRSYIVKGREEEGVNIVRIKTRRNKNILVLRPSMWRHGSIWGWGVLGLLRAGKEEKSFNDSLSWIQV